MLKKSLNFSCPDNDEFHIGNLISFIWRSPFFSVMFSDENIIEIVEKDAERFFWVGPFFPEVANGGSKCSLE